MGSRDPRSGGKGENTRSSSVTHCLLPATLQSLMTRNPLRVNRDGSRLSEPHNGCVGWGCESTVSSAPARERDKEELETIMLLISYLLIHQAVTFRGYIKERMSVTQSVKQLLFVFHQVLTAVSECRCCTSQVAGLWLQAGAFLSEWGRNFRWVISKQTRHKGDRTEFTKVIIKQV